MPIPCFHTDARSHPRAQVKHAFGPNCAFGAGSDYHLLMKVATGTVVKGTIIVDDPEFKDETDVFILTREREEEA